MYQTVPSHILAARASNARRVGERIKRLIDTGHLVYDAEGELITGVYFTGFGKSEDGLSFGSEHCRTVYFENDGEMDNGAFLTIQEFNAQFANWKYVHPADLKSLLAA